MTSQVHEHDDIRSYTKQQVDDTTQSMIGLQAANCHGGGAHSRCSLAESLALLKSTISDKTKVLSSKPVLGKLLVEAMQHHGIPAKLHSSEKELGVEKVGGRRRVVATMKRQRGNARARAYRV